MKELLRSRAVTARDELGEDERKVKSALITGLAWSVPELVAASTVMMYASAKSEVDTWNLIFSSLKAGKRIGLPVTDGPKIMAVEFKPDIKLVSGRFGIPEPDPRKSQIVQEDDLDLVIVPGVAFDRQGNRLGYGAGYYDRFLKGLKHRPLLIALAFDVQIMDEIPAEDHDVPLDLIVTESEIIDCRFERSSDNNRY